MTEPLSFSIVVPAHNEETCIASTLEHLKDLNYPAQKYEVLVVENGSSDRTLDLAKAFESGNFNVLQSGKGVSRAKNVGIDNLSLQSDWVIFLDADTILEKEFLSELNAFLQKPNTFSVGTVSLLPVPSKLKARLWFRFYDFGHIISRTSYSLNIVKRSLFLPAMPAQAGRAGPQLRFDEKLVTTEDLHMIRDAQRYGGFFFLWTNSALTSTRRFEKLGWWHVLFYWAFVAALPLKWRRYFRYDAVR